MNKKDCFDFVFISNHSEIEDIVWILSHMGYSVALIEQNDFVSKELENNYTLYYEQTAPLLSCFKEENILNNFLYQKKDSVFYYPENQPFLFLKQLQNNLQETSKGKYHLKKKQNEWLIKRPLFDYKRLKLECLKNAQKEGASLFNFCQINNIEQSENKTFKINFENKITKDNFNMNTHTIIQCSSESIPYNFHHSSPLEYKRENSILVGFQIKKERINIDKPLFFFIKGNKKCFIKKDNKYHHIFWLSTPSLFETETNIILNKINTFLQKNISYQDLYLKQLPDNKNCKFYISNPEEAPKNYKIDNNKSLLKLLLKIQSDKNLDIPQLKTESANFNKVHLEEHDLIEIEERKYHESYQIQANLPQIQNLFRTYGNEIDKIIEIAYDLYNEIDDKANVFKLSEIKYLSENEWLIKGEDYPNRISENL